MGALLVTLRRGAPAGATLPKFRPPAPPVAPRPPSGVLQSGRAPAQRSLFLRPGVAPR